MSKSLTSRRNARKEKGKAYKTSTRNSGYAQSRAPHSLPGPRERNVASMLVRNAPTELLRVDLVDWHREGETEILSATAHFACGCSRRRETRIEYKPGERQRIFEAMVGEQLDASLVTRLVNLRRGRWQLKQELLGGVQSSFGKGLPPHDHAESEAA